MTDVGAADGAPSVEPQQQGVTTEQLTILISGITALRESVEELRQETSRSQQEISQLRSRVDTEAASAATNQRQSVALHLTSPSPTLLTQTSSLPQPLSTSQNGALMPMADDFRGKLYPLPPFDGNAEDWPLFLANYNDTTNEFRYNNRQNLMRLHKSLQGEARRAVTSLLIFPDDVPKVIAELQFNFGRPDLLVRSQLEKVQQFPAIHEHRLEHVIAFSNRVRNIVAFFKSANCQHHLMNPTLLEQLVAKLPPSKQFEWSRHAASVVPFPTVDTFSDWISDLARVVSFMPLNTATRSYPVPPPQSRQVNVNTRASQQSAAGTAARRVMHNNHIDSEHATVVCAQCNQNHNTSDCKAFSALKTDDKWEVVKRSRLCFACLHKGHNVLNCRTKKYCGVNGCKRMHHQLLHQEAKSAQSTENGSEHVFNCRQEQCSLLFKVLPVELSGPLGRMIVYAMLDEGSSVSLLEEHISDALGLRGHAMPLTLQWYGDKKVTEHSKKVAVNIRACGNESEEFNLKNLRTVKNLNLPVQTFCKKTYEHLKTIPVAEYNEAKPVLLLGLDNCFLGVFKKVVEAGPDEPVAAMTRLGWMAFGPLSAQIASSPRVLHVRDASSPHNLHRLVEEYFEIESFGVRSAAALESEENARARRILAETTVKREKYYETGLLWRKDNNVLPSSFAMAKSRLSNLEAKMSKNAVFAQKYKEQIEGYVNKGYAKLLTPKEAEFESPTTWYLPHFGVFNAHKPDKLRVVFDAAAASSNVSLNSVLLKGPEHAKPLLTVLHKFRQGAIAVSGDVREMFSQVRIKKADQDSQRFLWRDGNSAQPLRVYAMVSMIFGAVCSPCCAEYVKNLNASDHADILPRGAKVTIGNMYVDDLVVSFDDEKEAEEVTMEAIKINVAAGFVLRNFVSNCKSLQFKLNNNDPSQLEVINMECQGTEKVLGMFWNSSKDSFEIHFKFHKVAKDVLASKRAPTKRETLSIVMSIFDPFGFLANFTIITKLLLQSTWKLQIAWDEQLPPQLCEKWYAWWKEFQRISIFSIPRCYSPVLSTADEIQLHIFADASSSAYAAVAYLRIRKGSRIDVAFVVGKTRCAPPKGMTIPRLELQAAVLASRLNVSVRECHDFHVNKIIFWSDSKTVILWIRSITRDYKQFVGCRIAEILETSTPDQWRWLPTDLNAADDATRAKLPPNFESPSRWTTGPEFLQHDEQHWPLEAQLMVSPHCATEEKPRPLLLMKQGENFINFSKFSSYLKMKRTVAWIFRFVANARKGSGERQKGELKAEELRNAENFICRQVQGDVFANEIAVLRTGKCVPKSSAIYALTPYLDEALLKVRGRLDNAICLPSSARRPIILPGKHYVSRLILSYFHHEAHHQNDHVTINTMRQKFWISNARSLLKTIKKECPVCIHQHAQPAAPFMGQLPADRLTPFVRPLSYTGVDYCGPFNVAIGRRREKRWVALFTCLTTRALHLEVAEDLSTDAFLICLRNFVNRRGMPVRIRSDNGINFIGAQKVLNIEDRLFDFDEIQRHMAKNNIEWIFNCPANPSAGGCWERLVQCVKRLLHKVVKEEVPRLETFRSVIIEAENIINSRPLTELPLSSEDEEPLTPNHFLLGCLNSTQTPSLEQEKPCTRKQWKIAQNLKDCLWKRWTVEYLPQLLLRTKWREEATPLQPGQLVVICDPSQPRGQWRKGRIIKVFTAADGQVRTAEIRTAQGNFRRSASKLAALTFGESHQGSTGGGMLAQSGNS